MLSEEKQVKLRERIKEWGAADNIPENVQDRVFHLGIQNPASDEEFHAICDAELWSYATIDWYMKFVKYLESTQVKDISPEKAKLVRDAITALQKVLTVLEAEGGE